MYKEELLELLRQDVVPALGCTEPVCVALCAAYASEIIEEDICDIYIETNSGIYKNGMSAGIPHCREVGLDYAAAIGAYLKNPAKKLEILEDINDQIIQKATSLINKNSVHVHYNPQENNLYVKCTIRAQSEKSICIIRDSHTNIVYLEKNGEILFSHSSVNHQNQNFDMINKLKEMKISKIRQAVDQMTLDELEFLYDGVIMNEALAEYSTHHSIGIGIAETLRQDMNGDVLANDLISRVMLKVSSAAESRLDGCPLTTMSSSGAGTKGIVVILPIHESAKTFCVTKEKELKALAFAHLVNRYINAYIGKLSPMCSCVMASSTAASAGITYLLNGSNEQIGYAIRNMCGTVTGMICDGGKVGCAMKVSIGSVAAIMSAVNAIKDVSLRISDGICASSPEQCIIHMARIGRDGMKDVDQTIISIMHEKK